MGPGCALWTTGIDHAALGWRPRSFGGAGFHMPRTATSELVQGRCHSRWTRFQPKRARSPWGPAREDFRLKPWYPFIGALVRSRSYPGPVAGQACEARDALFVNDSLRWMKTTRHTGIMGDEDLRKGWRGWETRKLLASGRVMDGDVGRRDMRRVFACCGRYQRVH
jgi:hypothetical protein